MDPFDLGGRVVVVTGALGRLGRRFTMALRARGARVAALDLVVDGPRVQQAFGDAEGVLCLQADVTSRASLEAALGRIVEQLGVPSGLINNAGLDAPPNAPIEENGPFEGYPQSSLERVLQVNVSGVVLCCQVFGGAMAEAGRGSIINIGSIYGSVSPDQRIYEYRRQRGEAFFKPIAYSASKSALLNVTRYLATYWGTRGVRVNTLTLGGVYDGQDATFVGNYTAHVPLGRMADPDEYNGAAIFLLSDASRYMTGANLVMDGGWTAW